MRTATSVLTVTNTKLIVATLALIGTAGIAAAIFTAPSLDKKEDKLLLGQCGGYNQQACQPCNEGLTAGDTRTCQCEKSTVWSGSSCIQPQASVKINIEQSTDEYVDTNIKSDDRLPATKSIQEGALLPRNVSKSVQDLQGNSPSRIIQGNLLYGHQGEPKNKLNIIFVGVNGYQANDFNPLIRYIVAHGLQAYSPFREQWSKMNVWSATAEGDMSSYDARVAFVQYIHKETKQYIPNSIIIAIQKTGNLRAYSWHNSPGSTLVGYTILSEDWSAMKYPDKNNNKILTSIIIHELGHALGGLSDEYSYDSESLPIGIKPLLGGNCLKQNAMPPVWRTYQGKVDWRLSQSGEVPLQLGLYGGCFPGNDYFRGTEKSLMMVDDKTSPIDYYHANLFLPFGYVNQGILENALEKFEGDTQSSCGLLNQKACGYFSNVTLDGDVCYSYVKDFQHLFLSREQSGNFCRACGKNGQKVCPQEEENVMGYTNQLANGCEKNLVNSQGICQSSQVENNCKNYYTYETNPAITSTILWNQPSFPRCSKDVNPKIWDVAPWNGYKATSTGATANDPEKCYDEYHSQDSPGVFSKYATYALYTKKINFDYIYETNPNNSSTILWNQPSFPRCSKDVNPKIWDVAPWNGYKATSTGATANDPEKCYDEYHSQYPVGVYSKYATYALYTKKINSECH